jgi:hypothetical protein
MAIWNYYHDASPLSMTNGARLWEFGGEEPGVKTPKSHPYSYDPFTIWKNGVKPFDAVYSDRLLGWDHKKHNELCKKHFSNQGQDWSRRDPSRIERFLRDYFDSPTLILCEVIQGCNVSNGYPYWAFRYTSNAYTE